jgi:hypothetical protein
LVAHPPAGNDGHGQFRPTKSPILHHDYISFFGPLRNRVFWDKYEVKRMKDEDPLPLAFVRFFVTGRCRRIRVFFEFSFESEFFASGEQGQGFLETPGFRLLPFRGDDPANKVPPASRRQRFKEILCFPVQRQGL